MSPWALTWDDENYYLIAYDSSVANIKHYRVDKMKNEIIKKNGFLSIGHKSLLKEK